ncbi:MAG: hypothetical protein WD187_03870 [Candidatus Woykebacteria bacterium]
MDGDVFKQFEEQFGREWKCNCGSLFESDWVEVVSKTKNTLLARYSCHVCGREQIFAISAAGQEELLDAPIFEIPSVSISSDDVLDIRREIKKINSTQIRALVKRKSRKANIPASKINRR